MSTAASGSIIRLDFARARKHGDARLRLLREAQDDGGFERVIVIAESWHVGQFRDRATGKLVDVLIVDEGEPDIDDAAKALTADMLTTSDAADVLYEDGRVARYAFEEKTPPTTLLRRWVCNLRANFGDTSAVV
jgi:hypothetical protein